jgi:hypothetical protein
MRVLLSVLALSLAACGWQGLTDPVSPNQEYMVSEMKRMEPMLGIGTFIAKFEKPPASTYAGWANCVPGRKAPWVIGFNVDYVETLTSRTYMTALVAHEMCHHWETKQTGGCYNEAAAETCAHYLTTMGRPKP